MSFQKALPLQFKETLHYCSDCTTLVNQHVQHLVLDGQGEDVQKFNFP